MCKNTNILDFRAGGTWQSTLRYSRLNTHSGKFIQQYCKGCTSRCSTQNLPPRFTLPKWHRVLQYKRTCNFIHARNKSTALPAPVFTKYRNVQQYYVIMQKMLEAQIHIQLRPSIKHGFHYANFTSNRTQTVEGMWERSCMPLSKLWLPVQRLSFNSQLPSPITWISSIANFTKTGQTHGKSG
jgi:hypothetical protein